MVNPKRNHRAVGVRFLIVGGGAFLVDAGLYNILVFWGGHGPLFSLPLVAKCIAIGVATVASYFGSKYFTYSDSPKPRSLSQFLLFALFNVIAIVLQLLCLGFSRYVLKLDDPVADNIWGTVVGQAVAMLFRFVAYGKWVFPPDSARPQ